MARFFRAINALMPATLLMASRSWIQTTISARGPSASMTIPVLRVPTNLKQESLSFLGATLAPRVSYLRLNLLSFISSLNPSRSNPLLFLGKYCDLFAASTPVGDCLAGHYCTLSSTLRSPVKELVNTASILTDSTQGGATVTNFF